MAKSRENQMLYRQYYRLVRHHMISDLGFYDWKKRNGYDTAEIKYTIEVG